MAASFHGSLEIEKALVYHLVVLGAVDPIACAQICSNTTGCSAFTASQLGVGSGGCFIKQSVASSQLVSDTSKDTYLKS